MAKETTKPKEETTEGSAYTAPAPAPTATPVPQNVSFSAEQLSVVNAMIEQAIKGQQASSPTSNAISVYNTRDPQKIEAIKVRRYDGMFVIGFKNYQVDPLKKIPKYTKQGVDVARKLTNEPLLTLLLSNDGVNIVEKDVMLVDYLSNREDFSTPVIHLEKKEIIHDHGILGSRPDSMGVAVDDKGKPVNQLSIKAESKSVIHIFTVQLPGFESTTQFIGDDFLA